MLTWVKGYKPIRLGVIFLLGFTRIISHTPISPLSSKSIEKSNTGSKEKCYQSVVINANKDWIGNCGLEIGHSQIFL